MSYSNEYRLNPLPGGSTIYSIFLIENNKFTYPTKDITKSLYAGICETLFLIIYSQTDT